MRTRDLIFASRPPCSPADRLLYNSLDIAFAPYGECWRQVRRIGVLHLLSAKRVESFRAVREAEVELVVEKIRKSKTLMNLSRMMVTLTNDIVCRAAFGCKYSDGNHPFYALLEELVSSLGSFPFKDSVPWFAWVDKLSGLDARLEKTFNGLDCFLEEVTEDYLNCSSNNGTADGNNFVQVLLSLYASESGGVSLGRDSIKALILMFPGGTETTFTAADWTMAELRRNPKVNFKGYDIPAKTRVVINAWALGRDPSYWEKAEEFMPERFTNSDVAFKGQHFQLIPFGAGRRGCPGMAFAVFVVELVVANLLHCFDWELPHGMRAEDLDMSESSGLTARRKASLIVRAAPRLSLVEYIAEIRVCFCVTCEASQRKHVLCVGRHSLPQWKQFAV